MGKRTRRTQMAHMFACHPEKVETVVPVESPVSERPSFRIAPKSTSAGTPEPQRKLLGRGIHDNPHESACLCARPKANVFCHFCGYIRMGRKKIQCPQHPTVHFLYDVDACQKCHAQTWYLEEYLV